MLKWILIWFSKLVWWFLFVGYLTETVQQRWVYYKSYNCELFSYFYMCFILSWLLNWSSAWTWLSKFKSQNWWTRPFHGASAALDISEVNTRDIFKLSQFFDEIIDKFAAAKTKTLLWNGIIARKAFHRSIFMWTVQGIISKEMFEDFIFVWKFCTNLLPSVFHMHSSVYP